MKGERRSKKNSEGVHSGKRNGLGGMAVSKIKGPGRGSGDHQLVPIGKKNRRSPKEGNYENPKALWHDFREQGSHPGAFTILYGNREGSEGC